MDDCGLVACALRMRLFAALIVRSTLVRRLKKETVDMKSNESKKSEKLTVPSMDVLCDL